MIREQAPAQTISLVRNDAKAGKQAKSNTDTGDDGDTGGLIFPSVAQNPDHRENETQSCCYQTQRMTTAQQANGGPASKRTHLNQLRIGTPYNRRLTPR